MLPYPFSPKKSYRTTGSIASKRSDRNANGRRARKSTERKEDATVLKRSSESSSDESTRRRWFRKFRERDRSSQDQAKSGRPSHVALDDIDEAIKKNVNPTEQELVKPYNCTLNNSRETAG
ncbi:hypothetical protein TNCV_4924811 [Trichonephila clavipes]|nr:hypothetical protein TNCV_4924811 [Trichonephila clavipes]